MLELSLFTGAGGGIHASKILGWRTIGYVERNPFRIAVIEQRIADGIFDEAPIFDSIEGFNATHARSYAGMVDVVTAGFPCQPFSQAGARRADGDERNLWPATADCLRLVRPRYAFLENVPGLLASGYFGTILGDLDTLGYDAEWGVLGAHDLGAYHLRDRLWIWCAGRRGASRGTPADPGVLGAEATRRAETDEPPRRRCRAHADLDGGRRSPSGLAAQDQSVGARGNIADGCGLPPGRPVSPWSAEPGMGRVVHGVAHWKHRIEALGDGQVPIVAATAARLLGLTARCRASGPRPPSR